MISSKVVRKTFRDAYPKLRNIWLRDKEYYSLKVDALVEFIGNNTPINGAGDCDDYATILHGRAREEGLKDYKGTWAFGECLVDKMLGRDAYHAMNVAITSNNKIWLIDPQSGGYWVANPKEDNIYFIFM